MITSYEIKKQNGEEVLYLYLDIDSEFAKLNFKEQGKKIEQVVKKFIEDNKIAFTGTTVALVVGGMLAGNIALNNNIDTTPVENPNNIVEVMPSKIPTQDIVLNVDGLEIKTVEKEEPNETVQVQGKVEKDTKDDIKIEVKVPTKETSKTETKQVIPTPIVEELKEEVKTPIVDTNTYVTIHRSNGSIITLELEEYIIGVVGAEMPAAFNEEALKAQAIVARTYALKSISTGRTLTDTSSTQNYKDIEQLKNIWGSSYSTYYNKVKNAVEKTKGMYLTYNGTYIEALYHSTSNGRTEDSSNVWGNSYPYLVSVESTYDDSNPSFIKSVAISYSELSSKLKMEVTIDTEFNILNKTTGNRIAAIEVNGKIYKGVEFRNLLGLRSADFDIEKTDTGVIFTTRGYGHGVGMSQYGANGMAKAGYNYEQILKHYYTGVSISHL
ncbi:MAG: stage II sporulation protein D [Bacilli bacterium]|nr:stage II sporulation protein D [Bacilli bacterium]